MTPVTSVRRRTPAQRQLTAAAVVTAVCLVAATLWICYVLVHLGDPNVHLPRDELAILVYALPTAGAGMLLHAHRPGSPLGWVMRVYALTDILQFTAAAPVWVEVTDPGIVGAAAALDALCRSINVTLFGRSQDFALVHNGLPIGELTVGLRAGEERLEASDIDILRSLADQASPAVASLRLQEDLQASREQIVAAREEERRWLRRDIHDGLGPALVTVRVDNEALTLTVRDDGVGYRPDGDSPADGSGVGLRSMADRAAEIGGHCSIRPLPSDRGTQVLAVLPRSAAATDHR
ncbi:MULTISPECIES: hypothetical protein [unclassified Kitasatospora]|uniref:ATP-binding protein n=1 Tax=unclassified Kitasatospora TaxID=2633591 RepID=UPI0033E82F9B